MATDGIKSKPRSKKGVVGEVALADLMLLLRKNGVQKFEDSGTGIKIEFGDRAQFPEPLIALDSTPETVTNTDQVSEDDLFYSSRLAPGLKG